MAKLTLEELANLSQLLLSTEDSNILLAFEIIKSHKEAILVLARELVVVWQMHHEADIKATARAILKTKCKLEQLKAWEKGFEIFSKIPNIYIYTPKAYEYIKNHENIRSDFQLFIEKNYNYALGYYLVAKRIHTNYKNHLELAELYYRIALKTNPLHDDLLFYLAFLLDKNEETYPEALQLYLKVESINSNHSAALNNIGVIYDNMNELELAYKYYSKALNLSPYYGLYLRNLGILCNNRLKGDEYKKQAKELLARLIKVEPGVATNWNSWADYLWNTENDYEAAEKAYLKGLEIDPQNHWLLGNLGELYIDIYKEYDKGLELYKKCLTIEETPYRMVTMVTVLVNHYQNYGDAKKYYKKLISISPPNQIIRNRYLRDDQWEAFLEAEKILKEKIK